LDDIRRWLSQLDDFWADRLTSLREHLDASP
jgi:hypothetical protein